jgi:hypothetical protein
MIEWCQGNLTPLNPAFQFMHHDVYSLSLAPENSPRRTLPIPAADSSFTLVIAYSVFTHLLQEQTRFYLRELRRVMRSDGILYSTWFFFYRQDFPVLAEYQNTLFVNEIDPTQAVYYDYNWFLSAANTAGLHPKSFIPPTTKNFQWCVLMTKL